MLPVGEVEEHARQGDAVGDAVVQPDHQRAAAAAALDQVDLPQRAVVVEVARHEIADELLQCALVAGRGERDAMDVQRQVEVVVVLPMRPAERPAPDHAPAEARVARHQAALDDATQPVEIERRFEHQDRHDDHAVGRAVHVQPRGVRGGHRVSRGHLTTLCAPVVRAIRALHATGCGEPAARFSSPRGWRRAPGRIPSRHDDDRAANGGPRGPRHRPRLR
jgi:hypothetical protein